MLEILAGRCTLFIFSLLFVSVLQAMQDHILVPLARRMWENTSCSDPTWSIKRDLYSKFENKIFIHQVSPWIILPEFMLVYTGLKKVAELVLNRYIEYKHLEIQRKELLGKSDQVS